MTYLPTQSCNPNQGVNLKTLIISNSYDQTIDVLLERMIDSHDHIFRLNFDLFDHYQFSLTATEFTIQDPTGRVCSSDDIVKVYYRKPQRNPDLTGSDAYRQNELWYVLKSLIFQLWRNNKIVLVEPFVEASRLDKFTQLAYAQTYFHIPPMRFFYHAPEMTKQEGDVVVKSLTSTRIDGKAVFTTQVNPQHLALDYPWLIQDFVEADVDLTVVVVRDKLYAFGLERTFVESSADWRENTESYRPENWLPWSIPLDLEKRILAYMKDLRLHYGRLDFLITTDGQYYFLENNPNGQYAWLDLFDKTGLLSQIIYQIDPNTEMIPIPWSPFPKQR